MDSAGSLDKFYLKMTSRRVKDSVEIWKERGKKREREGREGERWRRRVDNITT